MLTTDYGDATDFENRQREQTFRSVLSWDHMKSNWKLGVKGGYIHTWMAYDYKREVAPDNWASMTRSRSKVNTFYGQAEGEYSLDKKWFFTCQCIGTPAFGTERGQEHHLAGRWQGHRGL